MHERSPGGLWTLTFTVTVSLLPLLVCFPFTVFGLLRVNHGPKLVDGGFQKEALLSFKIRCHSKSERTINKTLLLNHSWGQLCYALSLYIWCQNYSFQTCLIKAGEGETRKGPKALNWRSPLSSAPPRGSAAAVPRAHRGFSSSSGRELPLCWLRGLVAASGGGGDDCGDHQAPSGSLQEPRNEPIPICLGFPAALTRFCQFDTR